MKTSCLAALVVTLPVLFACAKHQQERRLTLRHWPYFNYPTLLYTARTQGNALGSGSSSVVNPQPKRALPVSLLRDDNDSDSDDQDHYDGPDDRMLMRMRNLCARLKRKRGVSGISGGLGGRSHTDAENLVALLCDSSRF